MAKPQSAKQASKANESPESATPPTEASISAAPPTESTTPPASPSSAAPVAKKESAKPKKPAPTKGGSLLPSAYKLEQLKAAVAAAGGTEKLLLIMHHVEEAGGKAEVTESIEAYRVLKTVLEE